jgi:hypothetical protein
MTMPYFRSASFTLPFRRIAFLQSAKRGAPSECSGSTDYKSLKQQSKTLRYCAFTRDKVELPKS